MNYSENILHHKAPVSQALKELNIHSGSDALLLFIVDDDEKLVGSLTDGDIRRGLVSGAGLNSPVSEVMHRNVTAAHESDYKEKIRTIDKGQIKLLPVIDDEGKLLNIINLLAYKEILPFDAVIMAGGEGRRLRPLTLETPKPLLHVGDKPIIEHNIDRLIAHGVDNIYLSVKYMADQLKAYFSDGQQKGVRISYIEEEQPLGTVGAVGLIDDFQKEVILLMNSDLLTNIDFQEMYDEFERNEADLIVATVPYKVDIPYAVMETYEENVVAFKEKPTYTYQSNAGIYMFRREVVNFIPRGEHFNATDLMQTLIDKGRKVAYYPILGYWLDIGRHEDLNKAQQDIKHLKL